MAACVGMILKLIYPARFERLSILLYLGLGWSGVLIYERVITGLPLATIWLLVVGGVLYPQGCSSTSGKGCASTTRFGTPSCSRRQRAISVQSSSFSPEGPEVGWAAVYADFKLTF